MDPSKNKLLIGGVVVVLVIVAIKMWPTDPPVKKPDPAVVETSTGAPQPSVAIPPPPTASSAASAGSVPAITSGKPVDMGQLAAEAKLVDEARAALSAGEPRKALAACERWEHLPEPKSLKQEATMMKIESLAKVGRRTDALALAMSTRDDPSFAPYQGRIEAITMDAGLVSIPAGGPGP